jgi:hypothetical protein
MLRVLGKNVSKVIIGGLVAFLVGTVGAVTLPDQQEPGKPPATHPSNESPGGAGWDEINQVPKSTHKRIAEGCIYKAEMVFYMADEKRYNGGNVEKMTQFMLENMTEPEFRIKIKLYQHLHGWLDAYTTATPQWKAAGMPVHDVTWIFFNECMKNSYTAMSLSPVALTEYYMNKFGELLGEVLEGAVPIDT